MRKEQKQEIMIEGKVKSVLQQLVNEFSSSTTSLCYTYFSIEQALVDGENERCAKFNVNRIKMSKSA